MAKSHPVDVSRRFAHAPASDPARHVSDQARRCGRADLPTDPEVRARLQPHRLEPPVRVLQGTGRAGVVFLQRDAIQRAGRPMSGRGRKGFGEAGTLFEEDKDPLIKREGLELVRACYKIRESRVRKRIFEMAKAVGAASHAEIRAAVRNAEGCRARTQWNSVNSVQSALFVLRSGHVSCGTRSSARCVVAYVCRAYCHGVQDRARSTNSAGAKTIANRIRFCCSVGMLCSLED